MRPIKITANKTREVLEIIWDDNRVVPYPFQLLASSCRCASCNEERTQCAEQNKPFVPKSSILESIEPIGSYGINIIWKDGCRYGIYTWETLSGLQI
jgi:DUF971 family protein